jgi:hypothetical protein
MRRRSVVVPFREVEIGRHRGEKQQSRLEERLLSPTRSSAPEESGADRRRMEQIMKFRARVERPGAMKGLEVAQEIAITSPAVLELLQPHPYVALVLAVNASSGHQCGRYAAKTW